MQKRIIVIFAGMALASACASAPMATAQTCPFQPWTPDNSGTQKFYRAERADAYYWVASTMDVDADGAPNAYGPNNTGLDLNANAGYPNSPKAWPNILVPDPAQPDQPYVQPDGETKGMYVSQTALHDTTSPVTDPKKYVDARVIPYLVLPGNFFKGAGTGRLGDMGYALNLASGEKTAFIIADAGGSKPEFDEVSIALAEKLGGANVNPRTGAGKPKGPFAYVVFRKSSDDDASRRWPVSLVDIEAKATARLAAVGGIEGVQACIASGLN